jgi:hypothetical protein
MNFKNLAIAALIGAALSVVFSSVPLLNFTNCLLCAPYWAGAILAVWMYRRLTGSLTLGQGVVIGLASGVMATAASLAFSAFGLINTAELINKVQSAVNTDINIPSQTGSNFNCSIGIEFIFGIIGGLIGGALFRTDKAAPPSTEPLKPMNL